MTPDRPSPFALRGVIEGFYGPFYTFPERIDLIRFLGHHGFNFYLYGPKNDRQHRARWWEPYPSDVLDEFGRCLRAAEKAGIAFCYAITCALPREHGSEQDLDPVLAKFQTFFDRGCRSFAVFFDDLDDTYAVEGDPEGVRRVFRNVAGAHADCANRLLAWAHERDPSCSLFFCPSEYYGRPPFSAYTRDLGRLLYPDVLVLYTGAEICSRTISAADVAAYAEALGRPPVIWDNYPVNDGPMKRHLHIGPLTGRDPGLGRVCAGFAANLMNQAEASKIPLFTIADYLNDPAHYDPVRSWKRALGRIGGGSYDALRRFAENSLASPLQPEQAPELTALVEAALAALRRGERATDSEAVRDLTTYLDVIDESAYQLKNRMRNLTLRQEIMPWIEALEEKLWLGRAAVGALQAAEQGEDGQRWQRMMVELLADINRNPKRMAGDALLALAEFVRERTAATD